MGEEEAEEAEEGEVRLFLSIVVDVRDDENGGKRFQRQKTKFLPILLRLSRMMEGREMHGRKEGGEVGKDRVEAHRAGV